MLDNALKDGRMAIDTHAGGREFVSMTDDIALEMIRLVERHGKPVTIDCHGTLIQAWWMDGRVYTYAAPRDMVLIAGVTVWLAPNLCPRYTLA